MRYIKFRMILMMILTFGYMIVEIVVGQLYKSLTLTTDAFHMISDLLALTIGFSSLL